MNKLRYILFGIVFGLAVSACNKVTPSPQASPSQTMLTAISSTPTPLISSSTSLVLTNTPTASLTPSLTPILLPTKKQPNPAELPTATPTLIKLNDLQPGEYILYSTITRDGDKLNTALHLVSDDGMKLGTLYMGDFFWDATISPNRKYLAYVVSPNSPDEGAAVFVLDLETLKVAKINQPCSSAPELTWKPHETTLTVTCRDIRLFTLNDSGSEKWEQIAEIPFPMDTTGIPTECLRIKNLAWASNGQKLAYYLDFHVCEPGMFVGPFLADLICQSEPISCSLTPHEWPQQADKGGVSLIARSSGNRFLIIYPFELNTAGLSAGEYLFHIFDADTGNFLKTVINPIEQIYTPFLCSTDGEWLAVKPAKENALYLISVNDGQAMKLYEDTQVEIHQLISWITIPYPTIPGDTYTITEAGHDLNLRTTPSLAGDILRTLQPGDTVTVLAGWITADGYTWWKLKADDGTEGWAVNIPTWYAPTEH